MKKVILGVCVCLAVLSLVSSAFSEELWDWHLRGADEGLAYGALPPPGLYFINDFYWPGDTKVYNNAGQATNVKLSTYVDVPILLWNPGMCPILGAIYGCGIAQPFSNTTIRVDNGVETVSGQTVHLMNSGTQWGAYNTILIPFILSWEVPWDLHVSASLSVGLNDGTTSCGNSLASITKVYAQKGADPNIASNGNVYAWSSNDSYTFNPAIGISWLHNGWNLSAEYIYTFWTKDTDCDIQNGDQFYQEYTATYTCGKWTLGLGAEGTNQVFNDKGNTLVNGNLIYGKIPDSCAINYTAGPIVGYNFGPCSLMLVYNFAIMARNDVGSDFAMLRLVVPLGDPSTWYK